MTHERYLPPDLRLTAEAGHTISRVMDDLLGAEAFTLPRDDHDGPSDT